MASKLSKCGQCGSRPYGLVYREGDYWCENCTAALIAKFRKLFMRIDKKSKCRTCRYYSTWACLDPRGPRPCSKLRAQPKGKVLARGRIGKRHAKNMLCRWPKGAKCKGCIDQESCRPAEVREVVKGGGE